MIEIVLVLLGMIIFTVSFLLPAGRKGSEPDVQQIDEDEIKAIIEKEVKDAQAKIGDIVDETITYAMEKTERSMDRLTNEKMLAVNEYSDTVLEEINKNHKEVVFLYDMLNDKHENLKTTVTEAAKKVNEVKQTVKEAQAAAGEKKKETEEKQTDRVEPSKPAAARKTAGKPRGKKAALKEAQTDKEVLQSADVEAGNPKADEQAKGEEEAAEFKPISPRRVEIVYQPEEEYDVVKTQDEEKKKSPAKGKTAENAVEYQQEAAEVEVTLDASGGDGGRNSNERILELHKAGKSNMAIAKELGLGIGEVKLVIDLFEGL